jgi:hypothetical protein
VEVTEHEPLHRREEQVGERERGGRAGVDVPAGEGVERDGAGGDRGGLDDQQELGAWPEGPERSEQEQDRVEVRAEPRDLLAADVGDGEDVAGGRRPHRLRHVPEVEAAALEGPVPEDGDDAEDQGERERAAPDGAGGGHAATRSTSSRQRRARTSSPA